MFRISEAQVDCFKAMYEDRVGMLFTLRITPLFAILDRSIGKGNTMTFRFFGAGCPDGSHFVQISLADSFSSIARKGAEV